jgi:phage gp46-like protein
VAAVGEAAVADFRLLEQPQKPYPFGLPRNVAIDWVLTDQGLDETQTLASSIMVAVGTDATADLDDPLPDKWFDDDRRGWWGDLDTQEIWSGWPLGCRLWIFERDKITFAGYKGGATSVKIIGMIDTAIQPLVDLKVISNFTIQLAAIEANRIDVLVTLIRPKKPAISMIYSYVWDEISRNQSSVPYGQGQLTVP